MPECLQLCKRKGKCTRVAKVVLNKGRNGTNQGLIRKLQTVKSLSYYQDSYERKRKLQTRKKVEDCQVEYV